jgi:hypothetical protein
VLHPLFLGAENYRLLSLRHRDSTIMMRSGAGESVCGVGRGKRIQRVWLNTIKVRVFSAAYFRRCQEAGFHAGFQYSRLFWESGQASFFGQRRSSTLPLLRSLTWSLTDGPSPSPFPSSTLPLLHGHSPMRHRVPLPCIQQRSCNISPPWRLWQPHLASHQTDRRDSVLWRHPP